ncbi:uncharacterized protein LOC133295980 [Gastrolobium bilobum]|uniref:uncharacterized protein LOC133295980 n=1 Tax=Gastrolobium bilobum TaxID=150636 RepID=UPI002AB09A07|nr:uncharacterized protein LOC133295980 [Gastrolobium bilobum]
MAGMLPGVECARKRRLHRSGGGGGGCSYSPTLDSTRRSFCLYARNLQSPFSSSSLLQRNMLNQGYPDEKLGGAAREAKQRLDDKFTAHMKSENQSYNHKRKSLFHGLWHQLRS